MQRSGAFKSDLEVSEGRFLRQKSRFTDWVTADGSSGLRAEPGRYHLYVGRACPWSQRTMIVRHLKGDPGLRHARCVVVSAFSGEADIREATDAGAEAFVPKPFDPDDLSATVASLLSDAP